jgi:endothelin-converting enzyme
MTLKELQQLAPFIDWVSYFKKAFAEVNYPITQDEKVVVFSKDYFSNLSLLIKEYQQDDERKM